MIPPPVYQGKSEMSHVLRPDQHEWFHGIGADVVGSTQVGG